MSALTILLLILATTHAPIEVRRQIYVCLNPDGEHVFTDIKCATDTVEREPYDPPELLSYAPPVFAKESPPHTSGKRQNRRRERTNPAKLRKARKQLCTDALDALDQLRAQRRSGYSIREAARLERQEQALKVKKRKYC